jgi:hypothetical protein
MPFLPDLKTRLKNLGACLVGFADLSRLPDEAVLRVFRERLRGAPGNSAPAALSKHNYGISFDICGKCFYVCPFTQKWLRRSTLPARPE